CDVMGVSHQLQTPYSTPSYGFVAIIVAFLGRLNPIGAIFSGLLLALTFIGGEAAQTSLHIPDKIAKVFQGVLLFFVLACDTLVYYRLKWESRK
ncbi:MAG: ABC transporter permease, partial [Aestuariivirga sp.]